MIYPNLSSCKALFAPNTHSTVRVQKSRRRVVAMRMGDIVSNVRTDSAGVCASVYKNGVRGFSSLAATDEKAVKAVLDAATSNAAFLDARTGYGLPAIPVIGGGHISTERSVADVKQKRYVDFLREIDNYIVKNCPKVISRSLNAVEDSMTKELISSDGADGESCTPRSYIYVFLTANHKDGTPVELYEVFGGFGCFDEQFNTPDVLFPKIDELYRRLLDKTEAVYADAGEKICILDGILSGMLAHEAVGHTVESDLVLAGSVAKHCLNKQVASPLVSLTDFANTAFGETAPLPVYIDDEGVIATDAPIIKDGILVGYMHNRESARDFGVAPAGNARAFAYSDEPLVRMRNTAVHPGNSSVEDMIASIDDGYYLIDTGNGQADTTGEFMFGVTMGYEIKNGKLGRAILDTTISGVAFEMLKTVDMVGNKMVWASSGMCGKKQPMPVGMGGPALRCRVMIGGR